MKKLGITATIIGIILSVIGIILKLNMGSAISYIGGADGPTSVFIAGQVGGGQGLLPIVFGILLLLLGLCLLFKTKRK